MGKEIDERLDLVRKAMENIEWPWYGDDAYTRATILFATHCQLLMDSLMAQGWVVSDADGREVEDVRISEVFAAAWASSMTDERELN